MNTVFLRILTAFIGLLFFRSSFAKSYDCQILKMGRDGVSVLQTFSIDPSTLTAYRIELPDYKMVTYCYGYNATNPINETRLACSIDSTDLTWPDFSYGTTSSVSDGSSVFTVTTPIQIDRKNMIAVGCALQGLTVNFESIMVGGQ